MLPGEVVPEVPMQEYDTGTVDVVVTPFEVLVWVVVVHPLCGHVVPDSGKYATYETGLMQLVLAPYPYWVITCHAPDGSVVP